MMFHRIGLILLLVGVSAGCQRGEPSHGEAAHGAGDVGEIAWHAGDVAAAFRSAEQEGKPLFLYWGAVWCPPCNQVKTTVFNRPAFIEKTRSFVPVYLDGDTESAQNWADKFEVQGYPTMIVFDPAGNEITRIPGGIDIEAFGSVLDVALERMRSIDDLVLALRSGGDLAESDLTLLAYHSWDQDRSVAVPDDERVEFFRALAERVPDGLPAERSRLYLRYVVEALPAGAPDAVEQARMVERIRTILDDPTLLRTNLDSLVYSAGSIVRQLYPSDSPARQELIRRWSLAMESIRGDANLSTAQRLAAWYPAIAFHALENGDQAEPPESLRTGIREAVARADAATSDNHERQATINTSAHLLSDVGLDEEARTLLLAELERSPAPYYFMAALAALARDAGAPDEAVEWSGRAYAASTGRATRFQWGLGYVTTLMELKPADAEKIETETVRVLRELTALDDAFSGRNTRRLDRLEQKLAEWNAGGEHDRHVAAIRDAVHASCATFPESSSARERCSEFLSRS